MRRILTPFLLLLLFFTGDVHSQQVIIEGTGSASSYLYGPLYTQNAAPRNYRSAFIYPSSLLTTMPYGSTISGLHFNRTSAGIDLPPGNNLRLYLMNTTLNEWPAGALPWDVSGAILVFDGDPSSIIGNSAGYKLFNLINPFTYTGENIVVFSEYNQTTAPSANINWVYNTTTTQPAYNGNQGKYTASTTATIPTTMASTTGNHANMMIDFTPPPPCTAPPFPGAASASVSSVICTGEEVILDLSGNSYGTGQTYIWQSFAAPGGPYTDITSSSALTKTTVNPSASLYYRVAVTCGGNTEYSDSVFVEVAPLFPGGTYTINSAVATGGNNFQSFSEAVEAIRCGVTGPIVFNVDPSSGPYSENITIPQIYNTSATNTITFNGNGRSLHYTQNSTTGSRAAITLDGADYVTIDSLVINVANGTYGWGIQLLNDADYNTISNSTILASTTNEVNANHAGIIIGGTPTSPLAAGPSGEYNTIINNKVTGGYYGITLTGTTAAGTQRMDNIVSGNTIQDTYSHPIYAAYQSGAVISNNNISRPTRSTSATVGGIYLFTGNNNLLVEKNSIHGMFTMMPGSGAIFYGIYVSSKGTDTEPNRIVNNLVYDNVHSGSYYGLYNSAGDHMKTYHNTIHVNNDAVAATGVTYGVFITGAVPGIDVMNNIIYINRASTGIKRAIYIVSITAVTNVNNNVYYFADRMPGQDNYFGQWGQSAVYSNLAEWQTANLSAYDQLSHEIDPRFANPAAGDFTPTEPTIDNVGAAVGVTTDITGASRNATTPDAGAFEFTPAPCPTPPVAGTASYTPAGITCPNHQVVLSLSGGTYGAGQTFQWQSSTTQAGTFTDIAPASNFRSLVINPTTTMYYRAAVTCGGVTAYSDTLEVEVATFFPGGTYTINASQPTGGNNFQSFTDAVNAIRCGITGGVTFNVDSASGPYNEQISIPLIAGASSASPVIFNGNGATIQFASNADFRHVILLEGASHITFDRLRVAGLDATYGWGIHLIRYADSNTIKDCIIDMSAVTSTAVNNSVGISSTMYTTSYGSGLNASNTLITGNTIIGAHSGIVYFGKNNKITNNLIHDFAATGIMVTASDSVLIENNNIHRANRTTVSTFTGIELRAGTKNARINANRIHSTHTSATAQNGAAYGIFSSINDAPHGEENYITNNLIYNFNSQSGTIYGLYNSTSDGVYYLHNTVAFYNPAATGGVTHGFSEQSNLGRYGARVSAHGSMTIRNNIFYINRGGSGEKVAMSFMTNPNNVASNYNNLYNVSSETGNNIGKLGSTLYPTLADWQTAAANMYDQNSISVNPAFVDMLNDLTPTSTVMDNKGVFANITHDFFGALRSTTTPDMGAIEYDPSLPVTFLSFTGEKQGERNRLQWSTATEANNKGFELERSSNGQNFAKLAFVGSKAEEGNSVAELNYQFDDVSPLTGNNYYRLKQVDKDGKFTYSNIVVLRNENAGIVVVKTYPNPVKSVLNISVMASASEKVEIILTDMTGKLLVKQQHQAVMGNNQLQLNIGSLSAGMYLVKVVGEHGVDHAVHKILKQ